MMILNLIKNDFFKSFIDFKNIFNIKILKCYKTVLNIEDLQKIIAFLFLVSPQYFI